MNRALEAMQYTPSDATSPGLSTASSVATSPRAGSPSAIGQTARTRSSRSADRRSVCVTVVEEPGATHDAAAAAGPAPDGSGAGGAGIAAAGTRRAHRSRTAGTHAGVAVLTWDSLPGLGLLTAGPADGATEAASLSRGSSRSPSSPGHDLATAGPTMRMPHVLSDGDIRLMAAESTLFQRTPEELLNDLGGTVLPTLSSRQAGTRSRNRSRGKKSKREAAAAAAAGAGGVEALVGDDDVALPGSMSALTLSGSPDSAGSFGRASAAFDDDPLP